ncbi:MAG: hypothetical protein LBB98_15450, partial [Treponema sp.]|nr:hypothetical protein [Treponema sp.]
ADKIIAVGPDAETWNHLFGVYTGFYPWRDDRFGITLGYAGVFTQYLEEFSIKSETAMPRVFKSGVNLTARYKTDKLTIKTDHNFSFWSDKNYKIYYLYKPDAQRMKDYGLMAKTNSSSDVSEVLHSFLWNGIGASYKFTPVIEGNIYVRNLLRIDETPQYKMTINYFSLELKSSFHINSQVEVYGGITWHYTGRTVSESLPKVLGEFGANLPHGTSDYVNMIQIPVGLTVKLQ